MYTENCLKAIKEAWSDMVQAAGSEPISTSVIINTFIEEEEVSEDDASKCSWASGLI